MSRSLRTMFRPRLGARRLAIIVAVCVGSVGVSPFGGAPFGSPFVSTAHGQEDVALEHVAEPDRPLDEQGRLFREGVALREAGDLDGAIERLRRAYRLEDHDRTAYNLAAALADDGQLLESRFLVRRILGHEPDLLIADAARELLEQVGPRIAVVSVTIEGARPEQRLVVDGERSAIADEARDLSLDPGRHRLEVQAADGTVLARSELELEEGERRALVLRPVRAVAAVAAREPEQDGASAAAVSGHAPEPSDDTWLWVGIGSGIAAVVLAAVVVTAIVLGGQGGMSIDGDVDDVRVRGRD